MKWFKRMVTEAVQKHVDKWLLDTQTQKYNDLVSTQTIELKLINRITDISERVTKDKLLHASAILHDNTYSTVTAKMLSDTKLYVKIAERVAKLQIEK